MTRLFSSLARTLPLLVAVLLLVAGCDDVPTTTAMRRIEDPWAIAQGGGLLPVIVRGRPAFASEPAVEAAVFRLVEGAVTWTATPPFVRESAGDALGDLRVVFVFNGSGGDPCRGEALGGEPLPDGRVTLIASFCDGAEMLARVDGHVGRSAGLDSRPLVKLIEQATRDLLAPPSAPRP